MASHPPHAEQSASQLIDAALQHHMAGQLQQAEAIYKKILAQNPHHPEALHLLGVVYSQYGQNNLAIESIQKAIEQSPEPLFYNNLGVVFQSTGNVEKSIECYEHALQYKPNDAKAYFNLGVAYQALNNADKALHYYQQVLQINPNFAEAYHNIGFIFYQQNQFQEALHCYQQGLRLKPDFPDLQINLGNVYHKLNMFPQAIACYEQLIKTEPTRVTPFNNLGAIHRELGNLVEASDLFQKAITLDPACTAALNNLALVYKDQYQLKGAITYLKKAVDTDPNFFDAQKNLGEALISAGDMEEGLQAYEKSVALQPSDGLRIRMATALPPIYQTLKEVDDWHRRFIDEVTQLQNQSLQIQDPITEISITPFLLAYQGRNDKTAQQALSKLYESLNLWIQTPPTTSNPKPKIGFISRFLSKNHTIGKVFLGLVENMSREKFEIVLFNIGHSHQSPVTAPHTYINLFPSDLPKACQTIGNQNLDVLIYLDIGMEPLTYFLAFNRLAKTQCVTWGHPTTTAMDTIDYYLSSELFETKSSDDYYSEKLVRFKSIPAYYTRPILDEPLLPKSHFGFQDADHLYLCPQSLFKFHPDFDEILGDILRKDIAGILVLANAYHAQWSERLLQRFQKTLPDVLDRIRILDKMSYAEYLHLLSIGNVMLDTLHFGGGNTSYEALAMGTPVVTMPGSLLRGRMTYGLYTKMGIKDCIVDSPKKYVNLAVKLGTNTDYRQKIHQKIMQAHSVLFEDHGAVSELEDFLSQITQ